MTFWLLFIWLSPILIFFIWDYIWGFGKRADEFLNSGKPDVGMFYFALCVWPVAGPVVLLAFCASFIVIFVDFYILAKIFESRKRRILKRQNDTDPTHAGWKRT